MTHSRAETIIFDPMRIDSLTPTDGILGELGRRLELARRARERTQEQLAEEAGIGVATLRRMEDGSDARLGSWLRVLRALELEGRIDGLLPEEVRSPMAEVRGKRRPKGAGPFVWGDERG